MKLSYSFQILHICNIKAFQWNFHSIYMPAVVVVLQAVEMSSFPDAAAALIALSTDHWGNRPSNTKKPCCANLLFCGGQWGQRAFSLKMKRQLLSLY